MVTPRKVTGMSKKIETSDMWLVYEDSSGNKHYQPWTDLVECGTLIDPESDEDMEMIGWTTERNKRIEALRTIVLECQSDRVEGFLVDTYTASLILSCYDQGNDKTKSIIEKLNLKKVADICYQAAVKGHVK